ncbi:unnamed protein product [Penicillium roqueforti FM164]|uniref:Genomic scaffold, ProqFM164S01 n=1 Tax=Penicillium roqueforti (strain FM164) TaxID=1365484 RepID=W6PY97_PENRF|nr:unnamed protein product [Penicillium roqueforti FM164]
MPTTMTYCAHAICQQTIFQNGLDLNHSKSLWVTISNHAQWNICEGEHDYFDLDIGSNDIAEVQWWAAILTCGRGWEETLARISKHYYPPWECHLNSSSFKLHHCAEMSCSISTEPPSAAEAQEYLCNFARLYDAFVDGLPLVQKYSLP